MDLKARVTRTPPGPGQTTGSADGSAVGTGGAAAAVDVLNAEDDDGDDDAIPPQDFDYLTDGGHDEEEEL